MTPLHRYLCARSPDRTAPVNARGTTMSVCNNCGKSMLFGGRKIDGVTYCGGPCATSHTTWLAAGRVPADVLQQVVEQQRHSACPRCKKNNGPIDVHEEHRVHSFLIMTQWHTKRHVACRPCGRKAQAGGLVYSLLLGWWGMPLGPAGHADAGLPQHRRTGRADEGQGIAGIREAGTAAGRHPSAGDRAGSGRDALTRHPAKQKTHRSIA